MNSNRIALLLGSTAVFTVSQFGLNGAFAQDAAPAVETETTVLETIYVSGEKLLRSLQETASSVVLISSEDLEDKPDEKNVQEAVQDIPNVLYPGSLGTAPIIRGQDTQGPNTGALAYFSGTVPRASINLDGHNQSYFETVFGKTSTWDVDNIEVFRGPQTTSQGANSIAGAIVVNTKDPTFTPEGAFQAEYGSYNAHRISGMLSGPLTDQLAARVALDYYGRETFIDFINSSFTEDRTDTDIMSFNGRAKLLWTPDALPGLKAKLTYSASQNNQPTSEATNFTPYNSLKSTATSVPTFYQRSHTGIADISYEFENGVTVSNRTQFTDFYMQRTLESGNGDATVDQQSGSNELLVRFGNEESKFSGVAGLYASRTQSDESFSFAYSGSPDFDDTKDNLGLFSEVDYRFNERWTLTGGLRVESDRVQRSGQSTTTASGSSVNFDYDETFNEILPKIAIAYNFTPDVTVGGMINRGFNPGGVAFDFLNGNANPFEAETLWNYEIFGRANLLDEKLTLTGNVFYSDISNAQRYFKTTLPGSSVTQVLTLNAEEAYSYGVELGIGYQILDNLRVNANAGVLKTEITRFDSKPSVEGNDFSKSPGYMLGAGVEWAVLDNLVLSANVQHTDGYYSDDSNTVAYAIDSYTVANARATFQVHDHLEVYGYVDNIFDESTPTYIGNNSGVTATMLAPRMFGIGLKASF